MSYRQCMKLLYKICKATSSTSQTFIKTGAQTSENNHIPYILNFKMHIYFAVLSWVN